MTEGSDASYGPATLRQWVLTAGAGVLVFVAASAVFVGSLWAVSEVVADREVKLAAAFVFGLAFLLSVISSIVAAFSALRLTSPRSALGLPEGSIRAIIALVLVLIFIVMAIYLIEAVFLENNSTEEARTAGTQVLAMVGTLVAAVAAFYFGTGAVTTGAAAVTAAATARQGRPAAITKGSAPVDGGYELVGVVNPHGQETNYYFQYGPSNAYGNATPIASAGAGDAEREVRSEAILEIEPGWHLRIAAFNDAGTSYGNDAVVTEAPPDGAAGPDEPQPPEGGPGPDQPEAYEGPAREEPEAPGAADEPEQREAVDGEAQPDGLEAPDAPEQEHGELAEDVAERDDAAPPEHEGEPDERTPPA